MARGSMVFLTTILSTSENRDYRAETIAVIDYLMANASGVVAKVTPQIAKQRAIKLMEEVGIVLPQDPDVPGHAAEVAFQLAFQAGEEGVDHAVLGDGQGIDGILDHLAQVLGRGLAFLLVQPFRSAQFLPHGLLCHLQRPRAARYAHR